MSDALQIKPTYGQTTLLSAADKERLRALGADVGKVWSAPTTTDRDRKELLRTVLQEANIKIERKSSQAHITLRWSGGAVTDLDLDLQRRRAPRLRTDEDTIDLVRRLALLYPDSVITGILNRQDRRTANGERFTVNTVGNLRRYWKIPKFQRSSAPAIACMLDGAVDQEPFPYASLCCC